MDAKQDVFGVVGNQEKILIGGTEGVYILDFENENFPNSFSSWQRLSSGLPNNYQSEAIMIRDNKTYVSVDNQIYLSENYQDFNAIYTITDPGFKVLFMQEMFEIEKRISILKP